MVVSRVRFPGRGQVHLHRKEEIMRIYTIQNGKVATGAVVEELELKGAGIKIPVVTVGEK